MQRAALNHCFTHEAGCDHAEPRTRFDVLVKVSEAFKMKDTIDRRTALEALDSVPALGIPVVAMATPVDPILTAIEHDRIAYVAFAASLNRTDERKAAQEKGREVTQTDEDAYKAARGSGRVLLAVHSRFGGSLSARSDDDLLRASRHGHTASNGRG